MATVDAILASYAQIFFTRSRAVGALLLAATLSTPRLGLAGLAAVLLSLACVRLLHFNADQAARGVFGYNALLVGLAVAVYVGPARTPAVLALAVVAAVLVHAALESALGQLFGLPVLSLPFIVVTVIAVAAARPDYLHIAPASSWLSLDAPGDAATRSWILSILVQYLRSLGAIFFAPEPLAGALVLAALLRHSRIAVLLSAVGFAVARVVAGDMPDAVLVAGCNAVMTAIALGGVWFVPERAAFVLAAIAAALVAAMSMALVSLLSPLGVPVLVLPFNLAVLLVLYAMRQRTRDGAPKAVFAVTGSPEAHLANHRTHVARFSTRLAVPMTLPFYGRWTVTQGIGGSHTHRGAWRHALDFEVRDRAGRTYAGLGTALKDYHCYRLPVIAPAAGTVVQVVSDVPDNPVGQRNPSDTWGNLVLIQHGVGLYSLLCHLAPGSIEVQVGQVVWPGTRLGLCGNSGRSFVPHVHFQLQTSPVIGAPTCELELQDVVVESEEGTALRRACVPREGDVVRNLERKEEVAQLLSLPLGTRWTYLVSDGRGRTQRETVVSSIDLFNRLNLVREGSNDALHYENHARRFVAYDHAGARSSVLRLLQFAAPRVPLEHAAGLRWDDVLPARYLRSRAAGWLIDLIDPFLPAGGARIEYASEMEGGALWIRGRGRFGRRAIETTLRLVPGAGPALVEVSIGGERAVAKLVDIRKEEEHEDAMARGADDVPVDIGGGAAARGRDIAGSAALAV